MNASPLLNRIPASGDPTAGFGARRRLWELEKNWGQQSVSLYANLEAVPLVWPWRRSYCRYSEDDQPRTGELAGLCGGCKNLLVSAPLLCFAVVEGCQLDGRRCSKFLWAWCGGERIAATVSCSPRREVTVWSAPLRWLVFFLPGRITFSWKMLAHSPSSRRATTHNLRMRSLLVIAHGWKPTIMFSSPDSKKSLQLFNMI